MRASRLSLALGHLPQTQTAALSRFCVEPEFDSTDEVQGPYPDRPVFARPADPGPREVFFGTFCLRPSQFLLLDGGKPVPLGSRALEVLIVLLERPGELITKQDLMTRVWPNLFVEPANLTVHISALRRALRDGRDGNRFIINIPGRGYSFVAEVARPRRRAPLAIVSRTAPETEARIQGRGLSERGERDAQAIDSSRAFDS